MIVPKNDISNIIDLRARSYSIKIFCHLKLCLATTIHKFTFTDLNLETLIRLILLVMRIG